MTQLLTIRDSIQFAFSQALTNLMNVVPTLLGAFFILVVGWVVSGWLGNFVEKVLTRLGFEKAVKTSGFAELIEGSGTRFSTSGVVAELSKWFLRLIFIQAAAGVLSMPQITQVINSIILFIPRVAVAMVILITGSLVARFLARTVQGSVSKIGVSNSNFLALLTHYAVIGFSIIAALSQLEIASSIVNILFTALVSSVALAVGLAFGLGGRDVAAEITRGWYEAGKGHETKFRRKAS